jgi:hypothetical protein
VSATDGERRRFLSSARIGGNGQSLLRWHSLPQLRQRGRLAQFARTCPSSKQLKHLPTSSGGTGRDLRGGVLLLQRRRLCTKWNPSASGTPRARAGCATAGEVPGGCARGQDPGERPQRGHQSPDGSDGPRPKILTSKPKNWLTKEMTIYLVVFSFLICYFK